MAIVPVPTMTDTPPFPALADRAAGTYNSKAYAFGAHMGDVFNDEFVAVAASAFANATDATAKAVAAAGSATTAATKASEATASAMAAAASAATAGSATAFSDTNPVVKGSADPTKQLRFEVDGLTTGTTRTVTPQDKDGVMALMSDVDPRARVYFDSAANNALDFNGGLHQRWAPAPGAQTLTLNNWPAAGIRAEMLIEGVNLGAATITWPAGINWIKADGAFTTTFASNGVALQLSGIDFVCLFSRAGSATIYGSVLR